MNDTLVSNQISVFRSIITSLFHNSRIIPKTKQVLSIFVILVLFSSVGTEYTFGSNDYSSDYSKPLVWKDAEKINKISGFGYSPSRSNEGPNIGVSLKHLYEDMEILKPLTNSLRLYGVSPYVEDIVDTASKYNMTLNISVDLINDEQRINADIDKVLNLAEQNPDIINSIILEAFIPYDELTSGLVSQAEFVEKHKKAIKKIQEKVDYIHDNRYSDELKLGVVIVENAYLNHEYFEKTDFVLLYSIPYYTGADITTSVNSIFEEKQRILDNSEFIQNVWLEIGHPSSGPIIGCNDASPGHQLEFLHMFTKRAHEEKTDYFIFSAFDEAWKQQITKLNENNQTCNGVNMKNDDLYERIPERSFGVFTVEREMKSMMSPLLVTIMDKHHYSPSYEIQEISPSEWEITPTIDRSMISSSYAMKISIENTGDKPTILTIFNGDKIVKSLPVKESTEIFLDTTLYYDVMSSSFKIELMKNNKHSLFILPIANAEKENALPFNIDFSFVPKKLTDCFDNEHCIHVNYDEIQKEEKPNNMGYAILLVFGAIPIYWIMKKLCSEKKPKKSCNAIDS